jgi:hypothetical protein
MSDPINPDYYQRGGIECIDAIEAALGAEGFQCFIRGTIIKYAYRCGGKDEAAQELGKIEWYARRGKNSAARSKEVRDAEELAAFRSAKKRAKVPSKRRSVK